MDKQPFCQIGHRPSYQFRCAVLGCNWDGNDEYLLVPHPEIWPIANSLWRALAGVTISEMPESNSTICISHFEQRDLLRPESLLKIKDMMSSHFRYPFPTRHLPWGNDLSILINEYVDICSKTGEEEATILLSALVNFRDHDIPVGPGKVPIIKRDLVHAQIKAMSKRCSSSQTDESVRCYCEGELWKNGRCCGGRSPVNLHYCAVEGCPNSKAVAFEAGHCSHSALLVFPTSKYQRCWANFAKPMDSSWTPSIDNDRICVLHFRFDPNKGEHKPQRYPTERPSTWCEAWQKRKAIKMWWNGLSVEERERYLRENSFNATERRSNHEKQRSMRPFSHWLCFYPFTQMESDDQFRHFTGISLELFEIIAGTLKARYGRSQPRIREMVNEESRSISNLYQFSGRLEWPHGGLFCMLFAIRQAVSLGSMDSLFGIGKASHVIQIYSIMMADILGPLIRWPDCKQIPPPGFLPSYSDPRRQPAEIVGVLDVVTFESARSVVGGRIWKGSFVVVYNLYGAVIYRSRLFWWRSEVRLSVTFKDNKSVYQQIVKQAYEENLKALLERGEGQRVLLTTKNYGLRESDRNWLWLVGDERVRGERKLKRFLVESFEARLKKSFQLFRAPSWNLVSCGHLDEISTVCCGLVNLMPSVDWTKDEGGPNLFLADMF